MPNRMGIVGERPWHRCLLHGFWTKKRASVFDANSDLGSQPRGGANVTGTADAGRRVARHGTPETRYRLVCGERLWLSCVQNWREAGEDDGDEGWM